MSHDSRKHQGFRAVSANSLAGPLSPSAPGGRWLTAVVRIILPLVLAGGPSAVAQAPAERPNILFILADDFGWADVAYHGGRFDTPNLDRLMAEGVELDQHYVQPVCTPTRTALMSGRWTSRFGPHVLSPTNLRAMPPGTVTLPALLKTAGYTTYLSGKWHLGARPEWGPNHYGFDHSYGSMAGAVDPWTHQYRPGLYAKTWHRDCRPLDEEGNATELVARQAVAWIRERKRPWFVYVPFQAVHIPVDAPAEYKKRYEGRKFDDDPAKDESLHRYAAFVTQMDAKIGELIAALEATGQRENTLVVFHSDNGGLPAGDNPYISQVPPTPALSSNLPLRGHKGQLYEGGIRVVALANWPGKLTPGKVTAPMHAADWMPTLARLAGCAKPADLKWDGRDVWGVLTGEVKDPPPRTIYVPARTGAAVRHGEWKLIAFKEENRRELFNLAEDPYEKNDLAARHPEKVKELEQILEDLRKDDLKELPADLREATP